MQHDYTIDDASGAVVRADLNAALQALASNNAGAAAPGTTFAHEWWADTTNAVLKRRNAANSAWTIRDRTDAEGMVDKAAGFTVGLADFGKIFRCTAALTVTVTAAATLTDGFWFGIVNAHASGAVTIDPNAAETIDGAATKTVPAGFACFVFGNATLFRTIGMPPDAVGDSGAGGTRGLVPAAGAGDAAAGKYLKADLTFARPVSVAILQDQKADGTDGGSSTSGSWQTRTLNTEVSDADGIVSLAANLFTPAAGTYVAHCRTPLHSSGYCRQRLYNNTAAAAVALGNHQEALNTSDADQELWSIYVFTANGTDAYALQYQSVGSLATYGLGQNDNMTLGVEIYSSVYLMKIG